MKYSVGIALSETDLVCYAMERGKFILIDKKEVCFDFFDDKSNLERDLLCINKSLKEHFSAKDEISLVIAVSSFFNKNKRNDIMKIANSCGFNTVRIVDSYLAATIIFGIDNLEGEKVLVANLSKTSGKDFNKKYFEVSILNIKSKDEYYLLHKERVEFSIEDNLDEANLYKIGNTLNKALLSVNLDDDEIDKIIVISDQIEVEILKNIIKKFIDVNIIKSLPDLIAKGASLICDMEVSKSSTVALLEEMKCDNILPYSVGIKTLNDEFSVLIPRGSKLPIEKKVVYTTTMDYQEAVKISIYKGDDKIASNNIFCGEFILRNIEESLKGCTEILLAIKIDENQKLNILANNKKIKKNKEIDLLEL